MRPWYTFLRSGRADAFRMAEAMTRHTASRYYLGRFAMLGSRHNVRHWGCGAKEARISQAAYRRYYYYLTADDRTGDLMRAEADADYKATEIDPMRLASPLTKPLPYPGRVRGGRDWLAFVGNCMTEWEAPATRSGATKSSPTWTRLPPCRSASLTGPNQSTGTTRRPASSTRRPGGHVQSGHHHGRRRSGLRAEHTDRPRAEKSGAAAACTMLALTSSP